MVTSQTKPSDARLVAVLQQEPTAPAFLLTVDLQSRTLTVRRLTAASDAERSYELWLIPNKSASPHSLGLVGNDEFTTRPIPADFNAGVLRTASYAISLEPAGGSTPQHLAWTALGAITTTVWPAFAAWRPSRRPPILAVGNAVTVTAAFVALLGWLALETQGGADLGLAERLTSAVQTSWPFIVALALRRSASPAAEAKSDVDVKV